MKHASGSTIKEAALEPENKPQQWVTTEKISDFVYYSDKITIYSKTFTTACER
jgi:hypothetical protein